jgi:hypothetical protein
MAEEFALKQQRYDEDSALKRQRMEEDHALEMQRLREQLDEKLKLAADKIAEEYGINAEGAKAIYDLLAKYYGSDGALAKLTALGYSAMLEQSNSFLAQLSNVIAQYQGLMSQMASVTYPVSSLAGMGGLSNPGGYVNPSLAGMGGLANPYGYAKGGSFIATRPTSALFGEAGPELVTITPLSQIGKGITPSAGSGRSAGMNKIVVDVNLSPDLEARVVAKSLDSAAEIVTQINRSKS